MIRTATSEQGSAGRGVDSLRNGRVEVWWTRMGDGASVLGLDAGWLSPGEAARFRGILRPGKAESLKRSRLLLRLLLSCYLEIDPREVPLGADGKGKPRLEGMGGLGGSLKFSLSHSGDVAAFAFCLDGELGLDVQGFGPGPDYALMAARALKAEELAAAEAGGPGRFAPRFNALFSAKEALCKAGLDCEVFGPEGPALGLSPAESDHTNVFFRDPSPDWPWRLHSLSLERGYACALAYAGPPRPIALLSVRDLRADSFHDAISLMLWNCI